MSDYEQEEKKQKEIFRQLAIAEIKTWISAISEDERKKVALFIGPRSFTPEELLKEVDEDTEYGKQLVQMFNNLRIELSKKKEE